MATKPTGKPKGRPPSGAPVKDERVMLRLTEDERARLQLAIDAAGLPESTLAAIATNMAVDVILGKDRIDAASLVADMIARAARRGI